MLRQIEKSESERVWNEIICHIGRQSVEVVVVVVPLCGCLLTVLTVEPRPVGGLTIFFETLVPCVVAVLGGTGT